MLIISPRVTILQDKYIKQSLTYEECLEFLAYLQHSIDAPYRESRITSLNNQIKQYQKRAASALRWEEEHLKAASDYIVLTDKWLSQGAYWRALGTSITKWYYKNDCFFTWFSGVDSIQHINNAKLADNEFERLIASS
ncbi:hypothetical protein [Paenibacillus polymyxa]|uniref:hypothetical protein n=1 Tax=Paenibacillus polymyxa TaxID=1406 RepID=UPI00287F5565|nr:hypothetical protein [Paenibacillus polymyxa]